ncbi:hypothetical protein BJX68DRAFT_227479 [Aspergillus pseudodeflectus]|uniref:Uncharacterized protein n=2 Tax=Aspergillus subgen. Nidulantes TaxID=2720870 RepID=A0A0U5CQP3_ASPCI|nr:hypothetical protein ASPCAL08486 [Aspergillus calidoustus]
MKISMFSELALGRTLVLLLSACIVTSAISLDAIIHRIPRNLFGRSLPGSLALAPEGAVGQYQPPPGPVIYGALPTETGEIPQGTPLASTTQSTNTKPIGTPIDSGENKPNAIDDPRKHIAPVSEMDAFIMKTYTASACKGVSQSLASLVVSVSISLLCL